MSLEDDDDQDRTGGEVLPELEPLEDLDDAEFGLPPVDNPPTLEEILAEDDDLPRTVDDFDDDGGSSYAGFNDPGVGIGHLSVALHQLGLEGEEEVLHLRKPCIESYVFNFLIFKVNCIVYLRRLLGLLVAY